jgi:pyrrolidone-carboxylate peptidase
LVTGFGPFEGFPNNPSAELAKRCGARFEIVEVAYATTREFLQGLDPGRFDVLLHMGVHHKATQMHLEVLAHNQVLSRPDVRGLEIAGGQVRKGSPAIQAGTLWPSLELESFLRDEPAVLSYHAGTYLCNFIYFESLCRFPDKRVGFLHVPSENAMSLDTQEKTLTKLVRLIEGCPSAKQPAGGR